MRGARAVVLCCLAWSACGWLDAEPSLPEGTTGTARGPDTPGKWRKLRPRAVEDLTDEQRDVIAQLEALGYADGTRDVTSDSTITVHDRARVDAGWNLYASGHAAEAFLIDMDGQERHRWSTTFKEAFPDKRLSRRSPGVNHWRRVMLGDNGDLYAIFEGRGLVALDRDSQIKWARDNTAHHDMARLEGGGLAVLTRKGGVIPELHPTEPVLRDFIEFLGEDGEVTQRIDLLQALLDSEFADTLEDSKRSGDIFHTNSLEILDGSVADKHPAFQAGRALVSMRTLDAIGVVDLETQKFVWWHEGSYAKQHDANIRRDGRLMLFDNVGKPKTSRVLMFDLPDMNLSWSYAGNKSTPFRSATLGTVQELSNGNTLVTESEGGRAFELTPDKDIVWEFYNPHRAGDEGEFIAALFEVVRLPQDLDLSWLPEP